MISYWYNKGALHRYIYKKMTCPTFTKSKYFRITAGLTLLAMIAGIAYGIFLFNKKHSDLSNVKPAFTLSSTDLYSAFESDEIAATVKYTGKVIEVRGIVARVEYSSADSTLSITLHEDDQFSGVICTFGGIKDGSPVNPAPGDQITIRGECSGMLMDVLMNNCVIMEGEVSE